jgi:hypothetical protein
MEEMPFALFDEALTRHPAFGDSGYIQAQLEACYKRRLGKISADLPTAGLLLDSLGRASSQNRYHIIGDTAVRCAIQDALLQVKTGTKYGLPLDTCESIFRTALLHLEDDKQGGPLECNAFHINNLGSGDRLIGVWNEEGSKDVISQSFQYLVQQNYGASLCTPSASELEVLSEASKVLHELLPLLTRSALSHTHLIAIFPVSGWKRRGSSSNFRIGGTIFLNREALENPWWVVEHLLHESLHQKLYDFRHGHSLLVEDSLEHQIYQSERSLKVCSPWNIPDANKSNYWDTHRVVAAFHVYVHLALLCTLVEQRWPELETKYKSENAFLITKSRDAFDRAQYLGYSLKGSCWEELGLGGKHLIDWLLSILDALDPSPPPPGFYVHLLIDRYRKEARKIESILHSGEPDGLLAGGAHCSNLPKEIIALGEEELRTTRYVLSIAGGNRLNHLNNELAQCPDDGGILRFSKVRGIIAKSLSHLTPDDFQLTDSEGATTLGDAVTQMVENSSARLNMMLT